MQPHQYEYQYEYHEQAECVFVKCHNKRYNGYMCARHWQQVTGKEIPKEDKPKKRKRKKKRAPVEAPLDEPEHKPEPKARKLIGDDWTEEELSEAYNRLGSASAVAKEYGCSTGTMQAVFKRKNITKKRIYRNTGLCSTKGCGNKAHSKGLCNSCYNKRWRERQ